MTGVICGGLIALDLVFDVPDYPAEGTKTRATDIRWALGGGAARAAATVAALGGAARLVGAVGDDEAGRHVRRDLRRLGVDDSLVVTLPGARTSCSSVLIGAGGERTVINHRDPALMAAVAPGARVAADEAVLVDTRWTAGAAALLEAAARAGRPGIVDAEPPLEGTLPLLRQASHVAFSAHGLAEFAPGEVAQALAGAAARLGGWVAVTRGDRPVLMHDGARLAESAPRPVAAVSTLGAGDVWHGAFALALAGGWTEAEAAEAANAAAGCAVAGLLPERMPTRAEVEAALGRKLPV